MGLISPTMKDTIKTTFATCRKLGMSAVNAFAVARMGGARHARANALARIDSALAGVVHGSPMHAVNADESYTCGRFYR